MTVSDETNNRVVNRSEALVTFLVDLADKLPSIFPIKGNIQEQLNNLLSTIQGLRPPRILVIGRCRSGKSSLINAICGFKVSEISDTKPETGQAEWKEYFHGGTDLLHILDTRGLQETEPPRQMDLAKTPFDSIMQAVRQKCPDVVLFLCKATEVHAAAQEDLNVCESIVSEIKKRYSRELPVIGVLTKCDELAPPRILFPTDNERKNRNLEEQVQSFHSYLKERKQLRCSIKEVVPTVTYAEY